jgi:two-component sensor histidine kinase
MIAADGREVPVLILTTITQVDSGLVLSGVLADLTEVKAAELAQQNLMQELDHRVKNTFATVQSVMDQTLATSDGIDTFLETFRGRVAALAAVHDTMARSDWASIDLAELAGSSLAPFGKPPRVRTQGEGIRVTLDIGRSLGMVLHELATNAAKYGSLSTPEGTVSVRWRREIRGEQSTLFLDWDESGGPPVRQTTYRGYGLRLIEDLVPYELSGKASVRFVETGLHCEIEIPLTDLGKDTRSKRGDR